MTSPSDPHWCRLCSQLCVDSDQRDRWDRDKAAGDVREREREREREGWPARLEREQDDDGGEGGGEEAADGRHNLQLHKGDGYWPLLQSHDESPESAGCDTAVVTDGAVESCRGSWMDEKEEEEEEEEEGGDDAYPALLEARTAFDWRRWGRQAEGV